MQAVQYLFTFDLQKISVSSFLLAFEHAFYTLSIGVGSLIVFGAYMPNRGAVGLIVFSVALFDILVSGVLGLVTIPTLFFSQMLPVSGYDLLFVALPTAYGDMQNGQYLGVLFFTFVMFTALSSALVLLEPSIAWCKERFAMARWNATVLVGFVAWLMSLACIYSWSSISASSGIDLSLFDILNLMTAKLLLPAAGLLLAIYVGWVLKPALVKTEIVNSGIGWLYIWYFLIRFIVPGLFILVLVLNQLEI